MKYSEDEISNMGAKELVNLAYNLGPVILDPLLMETALKRMADLYEGVCDQLPKPEVVVEYVYEKPNTFRHEMGG